MDKTAIKNFAIWARKKLISDTMNKASLLGISEAGIQPAVRAGEDWLVDIPALGRKEVLSEEVAKKRERLVARLEDRMKGEDYKTAYHSFMEEVSYTWFNRLIAIRFMEVNDYIPGHIRVLSSLKPGKKEPDLVSDPFSSRLRFSDAEIEKIQKWQLSSDSDSIFHVVFLKQCNALHDLLPKLFEKTDEETELLLSLSVMDEEGVVYRLTHDIPEEDWKDQVQIIGWLYQYYNTEPKDKAFAKKGKITKNEIPAVTQLFTPDWIVRYMVENSLGRFWIESHPNDRLKSNWTYYVDNAKQDEEVQKELEEQWRKNQKIPLEKIRCIDPCMGSGHILVYMFDVLMQIYESEGYSQDQAAVSILKNNLFGLDIDDRAFQLAYFSVMMKARQYNRKILRLGIIPHVYSIPESNGIDEGALEMLDINLPAQEKKNAIEEVKKLLDAFRDAKEYGSLLKMPLLDWILLDSFVDKDNQSMQLSLSSDDELIDKLREFIDVAKILSRQYEAVVTNPPYMGGSKMNSKLSDFAISKFSNYKYDLFSMFIIRCTDFGMQNGYVGFLTPYVWMFIHSYESLRNYIYFKKNIQSLIQFEYSAFEEATVPICTFVLKNNSLLQKGTYLRLTSFRGGMEVQRKRTLEALKSHDKNVYFEANTRNFSQIPGEPVAYWVPERVLKIFSYPAVASITFSDGQNKTGNNDKFIRKCWEVSSQFVGKNNIWVLCARGGGYKKWYGFIIDVIDWSLNARNFYRADHVARIVSEYIWYQKGVTWSRITSSKRSFRIQKDDMLFEMSGLTLFLKKDDEIYLNYLLAFLNSVVAEYIIKIITQVMTLQIRDVQCLPIIIPKDIVKINDISVSNIHIARVDWDSFETSWDFNFHPLFPMDHIKDARVSQWQNDRMDKLGQLAWNYENYKKEVNARFDELKKNEEELNRIFIEIYGLEGELTPEESMKDVTVHRLYDSDEEVEEDMKGSAYILTKKDVAKSLISYAVGCMFGRYSLDVPGLAYAGGDWDDSKYGTFRPDEDNVIPITDENYFPDDMTGRFEAWMKAAYGEKHLQENMRWVAEALGKKGPARDVIREYFLKDFYKDHVKMYQKRPIYWLYDSGKKNGFKALIYMHRYNKETTGVVSSKYVNRMTHLYENQIMQCENIMSSGDAREAGKAEKRKEKLTAQLRECREYYTSINHLALAYVDIDLDDGVKVNYEKVQTDKEGKKYPLLAKI